MSRSATDQGGEKLVTGAWNGQCSNRDWWIQTALNTENPHQEMEASWWYLALPCHSGAASDKSSECMEKKS